MNLAPVCLFTYNRLEETKQTVLALQKNILAKESILYVYSDGWKKDIDKNKVLETRKFLKTITGFKRLIIVESNTNKGLANSIIEGVTDVIEKHGKIIVLEDDLITSQNFLTFINKALNHYMVYDEVYSISGYSFDLPVLKKIKKDTYLGVRASSWGWATWKSRWENIDWDVKDYQDFENSKILQKEFNKGGSDMSRMLRNQMTGKIDSWAIRWCYQQFKNNQFTVFPKESKLINIGFGENATHTKTTRRFDTVLDVSNKLEFEFENSMVLNKKITKQFKNRFSIIRRLIDKFN